MGEPKMADAPICMQFRASAVDLVPRTQRYELVSSLESLVAGTRRGPEMRSARRAHAGRRIWPGCDVPRGPGGPVWPAQLANPFIERGVETFLRTGFL